MEAKIAASSVSLHNPPGAIRRLKVACAVVGVVIAGYWAAVASGVSEDTLSPVFTLAMCVLVVLSWCAVRRVSSELRLFVLLAAIALTLALIGVALWYVAYSANNHEVPDPPGYWTPFLWVGLALGIAAAWVSVRSVLRLREAALDYLVVIAAAAALAVATVDYQLEPGLSGAAFDAAMRPVAGILIVVIVVSAALGRWRTLPLPVGLFALANVFTAMGSILFGWWTAEGDYTDARWPDALWFVGIMVGNLNAIAMILRIERPIRVSREALPAVSPRALMATALGAWAVAGGTTLYGAIDDRLTVVFAGIAASLVIGFAVAMRSLAALRESRAAYRRLDEAHFALEQAVAEHEKTIEAFAQRDVEQKAAQAMYGALLELADDRSDGELRARLEEAADDVVDWLPLRRP